MGLPPITGIRGDGLADPRRTGSIEAAHFQVSTAAAAPGQRHGQRHQQHEQEQELPYEDAEFVEITEVSEPEIERETVPVELSAGHHFHAIA